MLLLGLFSGTLPGKNSTKCCPFFDLVFWLVVWGGRLAFRKSSLCLRVVVTRFCGIKLSPLTRCVLGVWFRVCCSTKCCSFSVWFFSGCRVLVFRGCVKVLSVLGWLLMTSLVDQIGSRKLLGLVSSSVCYNSTKCCCFTERPCLHGYAVLGTGCFRTVFFFGDSGLLELKVRVLLWLVSALSLLSFSLFSFFLSFFLSLSLSWLDLQEQAACFLTTT